MSDIWNYTLDYWSVKHADKYYNEIINQCSKLAYSPENSRSYSSLLAGLRGSRINKHIIFFRQINDKVIEVERILHERMDLKSQFAK